MAVTKKYWWYDEPEIGSYKFCHGGSWDYDFYIEEVSVKYVYGWTEEERQRRFMGAKFIWGGCCGGVSYHDVLKADNIEDAKREFEAWYKQYLACCVADLVIFTADGLLITVSNESCMEVMTSPRVLIVELSCPCDCLLFSRVA